MAQAEMPQIVASAYINNTVDPMQAVQAAQWMGVPATGGVAASARRRLGKPSASVLAHRGEPSVYYEEVLATAEEAEMAAEEAEMANTRRLVQIFICDPDDNVPLDQCLLYSGQAQLTDLTDQELYFEVDIRSLLAAHNEKRRTLRNKAVKERDEFLEPARVRDLKMTVVTIAQF